MVLIQLKKHRQLTKFFFVTQCNCTLYKREKAKTQVYPQQMTDIPDRLFDFDKIVIDLVLDLNVFVSGNQHILIITDHLMGLPEAFPILDKRADTNVYVFINNYMPVHICLCHILSDNSTEFKKQLMDNILQQLGIDHIFYAPYCPQIMENWRYSTNTLNLLLRNFMKRIWTTGTSISTKH